MPVIWLIDAYRAGERGQVRALVEALGWPLEIKVLSYHKYVFWPHVLGWDTLRGIPPSPPLCCGRPGRIWWSPVVCAMSRFAAGSEPSPVAAPAMCMWGAPGGHWMPSTW